MAYKRALVTGGAGFIGSHVADALIRRHVKTFVVDDLSTGDRKNVNPNAEFVKHSVSAPSFPALVKKLKPDVIFHLAAQVNVRASVADPVADARANILGTVQLIAAAKAAGVKKVVFSSSGGAMFSDRVKPPYAETQPAEPVSPYGIAKRTGEMYLDFARMSFGIDTVALRYANVYGPRQNTKGEAGVVALFGAGMLAGKPLVVNGDGKQTRDFVYVGDVVAANMAALKKVSGIFHIGTGRETSVNALYKTLKRLTGYRGVETHAPAAPGEVRRSALDARLAKRELGWQPTVSLEEGLARTVAWLKKHG
jgi:UDP-glucose 4-epimerase